jgi:hypothetical protein
LAKKLLSINVLRDLMIIVLRALYDSQRETHGFQILRSGTFDHRPYDRRSVSPSKYRQ